MTEHEYELAATQIPDQVQSHFTVGEVAEVLFKTPVGVRKLIDLGTLKAKPTGMIHRPDLLRFLKQFCGGPETLHEWEESKRETRA